ncbi:MAG: aminotransferase class I/II-fold pyridoxal phosphate-dependent enzyme [Pseudomonadota bacterium]|jgi:7-keto-8-aminopelargonate synthetase-like enzyme
MKPPIKIELARELAAEIAPAPIDVGLRSGVDALHPLYRTGIVTSFATWNVLDMWGHKEIKTAAIHSLQEYGESACASRYLGGLCSLHATCEARAARFLAAESALLFATKNQAILTLITSLATGGGVVIGPSMSALPLADACALVDLEFVECETIAEYQIALERYQAAPRLIAVAESVSATTGSKLDIPAWFTALAQYNAWAVLDESTAIVHSGLRGAGSAEVLPTAPLLLARILGAATLTGGHLAALVCSHEVRELLLHRSRYLRVEPPPSAVEVASLSSALDLAEVAISQRDRLAARTRLVQLALREQGWQLVSSDDVPIAALWFDTYQQARGIQDALLQRSIVVDAVPARSIRRTGAVVRIVLSSGHSDLEVTRLLDSLLEIRKRMLGQQEG